MLKRFPNRHEAGRFLAEKLKHFSIRPKVAVLGLPRGGVPVAFEIAKRIAAPLDIVVVRKLGVPGQKELAMGAIASGGVRVLNDEIVRHLGISNHIINDLTAMEEREVTRQELEYRGNHPPLDYRGLAVILVDDGLATGASMRVAARALKMKGAAHIIVAVPVGSLEACREIRNQTDEVICGQCLDDFQSVGAYYEDFSEVTDTEVRELLGQVSLVAVNPS